MQIDPEQFNKILSYIKSGVESGATLETGGDKLGSKGYYVKPTVFSNVKVRLPDLPHFSSFSVYDSNLTPLNMASG